MSINLNLQASAQAILRLENERTQNRIIVERFEIPQTPTEVTERILNSEDRLQAFLDWIRKEWPEDTEEVEVQAWEEDPSTFFSEEGQKVIKVEVVDSKRVKLEKNLFEWLKLHKGWKIEWFAL